MVIPVLRHNIHTQNTSTLVPSLTIYELAKMEQELDIEYYICGIGYLATISIWHDWHPICYGSTRNIYITNLKLTYFWVIAGVVAALAGGGGGSVIHEHH